MKRYHCPRKRCQQIRKRQRGATLIEVLVAVVIVSVGLAGLLALQARALQLSDSAYLRSQAALLGYYMMDVLRADRSRALAGNYNMNKTCNVSILGSGLAAELRRDWLQAIKNNLGNNDNTCGAIQCIGASSTCTVQIFWDDSRAGGGVSTEYQLTSRL